MQRFIKGILRFLRNVLITVVIAAIVLVIACWLFINKTAYAPEEIETVETSGRSELVISPGQSLSILTWNIGNGASGSDAEYFLDGGESVLATTEERVKENTEAVTALLKEINPNVMLLQQVDFNSTRSYYYDETQAISNAFEETESAFAIDHKAHLVPWPWPMIGKIKGGSLTLSQINESDAERIALTATAKKPDNLFTVRPCLLVTRYPVYGTEQQLVIINVRLIAYENPEEIRTQMTALHDFMKAEYEKGNFVIAGGDFHQSFATEEHSFPVVEGRWQAERIASDLFEEGWRVTTGYNDIPTERSLNLPYKEGTREQIQFSLTDGFITSPNIGIDSVEVRDTQFGPADHNPVLIRIKLQ